MVYILLWLGTIPSSIGCLTKLASVRLSNNELTGMHWYYEC